MTDMRDDLLATLGAAQEGADLPALADSFCQRWEKQARTERRITPPPWSGWFEFFGWTWVALVLAGLVMWCIAGMTFNSNNTPLNIATLCDFMAAMPFFLKWLDMSAKNGFWEP